MKTSREQFEEWLLESNSVKAYNMPAFMDGKYVNWDIQFAWESWQASRNAIIKP